MILDWIQAKHACDHQRRCMNRVVFSNGVYDLIHVGHIRLLKRAASLGAYLIVGINSDASVKRIKGESRPFQSEQDRAEIIASMGCVSDAVIFEQDTPLELIKLLRPDVLVKGGDWKRENIVGGDEVESWGGKVVIVPTVEGHSTTGIIETAVQRYASSERSF